MNIFKHEINQNIKTVYIWAPVLIVTAIFFMIFYPSISADVDIFNKLLDNYPEAMKAAFGLGALDISSAIGYYAFVFIYVALFAAIQASNLGVLVFSKEARDKTSDFLLTKPISRTTVLKSKMLACLSLIVLTNLIYNIVTISYMYMFYADGLILKTLLLLNISLFIIQLIFFSTGMLVAVVLKRIRAVLPISLGIVFIFFILNFIVLMGKEDNFLKFLTPFQYFVSNEIVETSSYEIKYILSTVIIVIVCTFCSFVVYKKKDII